MSDEKLMAYVLGNSRKENSRSLLESLGNLLKTDFDVVLSDTQESDVQLHLALGAILDADIVCVVLDEFEEPEATILGIIFGIGLLPDPINGCRKRPIITFGQMPSKLIQGITTAHYNIQTLSQSDFTKLKALACMGVYK